MAYIGKKIREEAYNCKECSTLKEHIEKCTLKPYKIKYKYGKSYSKILKV